MNDTDETPGPGEGLPPPSIQRASMKRFLPLALILQAACVSAQSQSALDPDVQVAERVLSTTPLFDGHNDLPWAIRQYTGGPRNVVAYDLRQRTPGHTDIPRLREGHVGAQFWSVYVPSGAVREGAAKVQLEQIDIAKQVFARYPDVFQETLSPAEVMPAFRSGRIASVMGMEGGHVIENSLGALRSFFDLGARYMTLTHSANTDWADAATGLPEHDGLTEFGMEVVREMNRLGMLVDLSHVATATMHDALDVSEAPVIFSHSSARAVTDVPRNVPDDVLRRIPENGGVVMVTFVPGFVRREIAEWERLPPSVRGPAPRNATMDDVILHIEHVRDVAGIDHVGIGADFDGIDQVPVGLEDVSSYPDLFAELSRRGWSETDLRKLAGENVIRAWTEAERVAQRLQLQRAPSTSTIEELDR
jgi:membrane dipeptidase